MLLYDVPEINAIQILAHEAGHIHCRKARAAYTSEEEGFCEFVAYQALEWVGTAEASALRNRMLCNSHIYYGGKLKNLLRCRRRLQGEPHVHGQRSA